MATAESISFGSTQYWTAPYYVWAAASGTAYIWNGGYGGAGPYLSLGAEGFSGGYGGYGGDSGNFPYQTVPNGQYLVTVGAGGSPGGYFSWTTGNAGGQSYFNGAALNVYAGGGNAGPNGFVGGGGGGSAGASGDGGAASGQSGGAGGGTFAGGSGSGGNGGGLNAGGAGGNLYGGGGGGCGGSNFESGGPGAQGVVTYFYTAVDAPVISSLSPPSSTDTPTTQINIFGSSFSTTSGVYIAGILTGYDVISDNQILSNIPTIGQQAPVGTTVQVNNQVGAATFGFTYIPNAPVISGITSTISMAGGTIVVTGSYFTTVTTVELNGTPIGFTHISDNQLNVNMPAQSPQFAFEVTISLFNSTGSASTITTYIPIVPAILGISPVQGDEAGGTTVTISGSSFTTVSSVYFGGAASPSFTINSDSVITAKAPISSQATQSVGSVNVTVTNQTATSGFDIAAIYLYTYEGWPANHQASVL